MVRLIVTKDKQLKNIKISAATKSLENNVLTVLQKQKVTQPGKKDGIPVDTQISLTLMFTIN
ncbi:energy transducer TonB [Kordia sp.]|uniref:energy transducer TonB n=1 Tax=Kordia sp. TaxID=1965332 RepID=UPI0025C47952|nr:energy transducer TonB [Kordia sp.]MCH2193343.1 energy transducer TonB [Kordia sp.]